MDQLDDVLVCFAHEEALHYEQLSQSRLIYFNRVDVLEIRFSVVLATTGSYFFEFVLDADCPIVIVLAPEVYKIVLFKFKELKRADRVNPLVLTLVVNNVPVLLCAERENIHALARKSYEILVRACNQAKNFSFPEMERLMSTESGLALLPREVLNRNLINV